MTQTLQTSLTPQIRRKLAHLGGTIRRRLLVEGISWVICALILAALASVVVDFGLYRLTRQHMSAAQRLLVIGAGLAGVAWIAWRRLVRPQLLRLSEDDLALVVERAHPELADRLISALQFSRLEELQSRGASRLLVERLLAQANEMASPLRFTAAVRADRSLKHLLFAAAAVAVLAGAFAVKRDVMRIWLQRVALLQNAEYPRDTKLAMEGPMRIRVGRGSALEVAVVADERRVVPNEVTFRMKFPSVGAVDETVPPTAAAANRFVKKFEVVSEPFSFTVVGHDDETQRVSVEVAEPPQLREVTFSIIPPEYTHLTPPPVTAAQGMLTVPVDSTVAINATATKDLARVKLLLDGQEPRQAGSKCQIVDVADKEVTRRRGINAEFRAAAPKTGKTSLSLRFELRDTEGFVSTHSAQYTLLLQADKPPTIQAQVVGISGQVSTRAVIPVLLTAKDDYGVKQVDVEWSLASSAEKRVRMPIRVFEPDAKEPQPFYCMLDLQRVAADAPAGDKAAPKIVVGESLRIQAVALDTLPKPEGPNAGLSNMITLRIASDEELLASMVEQQRSLREQFRQVVVQQAEAKGKTDSAVERARDARGVGEAQKLAAECADQQQQINDRTAALAARFEDVLQQMSNNRVGNDADKKRLKDKIIAPLGNLAILMKELALDLAAASKKKLAQDLLHTELQRLATAQDKIKQQMDGILGEMVRVENAQQVEHGLKVIIDMSQKVKTQITAQRTQEPTSQPAPK